MKNIAVFILLIFTLLLLSCNNEKVETTFPIFDKVYYEKPLLNIEQSIQFQGNINNYDLVVEDNKILEASIKKEYLYILTKKKGIAKIYFKNNHTGESKSISIKVVDRYMGLSVESPISSYYAYGDKLFFINNKTKDVYWYDESLKIKKKGCYNFYLKDENFYLSLSFDKDSSVYDISRSSSIFLFKVLPALLDTSWRKKITSREVVPINIEALDIHSSKTTYFSLSKDEMPYNIIE